MDSTKKRSKPTMKQLRKAIDLIFQKFDTDKNGQLDQQQIFFMLSQSLKKNGIRAKATQKQVQEFFNKADHDNSGMIGKQELFDILRKFLELI